MSATWASGYVADVAYTLGFYRELAPTFLHFACIVNGVEGPPIDRPLRYCELGCGRGYGTILLAAANPDSHFVGIDFNPSHIAEARGLASRAKLTNVTFHEISFADAARTNDHRLSDFDIVALHGVYTWVERQVRKDIVEFLREKLVSGGHFFASYNCMPGWATITPIQRLLMEIDNRSTRPSIAVINEGLDLLNKLIDQPSAFITQNPGLKARIEKMAKQDKNYLAHEFLNSGWEPLYVTETMANFSEAKMTYVGSASLVENRLDLCVPQHFQALLNDAPDVGLRELMKDYIVNKQFRRDIYVKGPQRLSAGQQRDRINATVFAPAGIASESIGKFALPVGEITLKPEGVAALTLVVAAQPARGAELMAAAKQAGLSKDEALLVLTLLVNASAIAPARPDHATVDRTASIRLNNTLMELTLLADTHRFLAAPVLGSAVAASFLDRIAAFAAAQVNTTSDTECAAYAFAALARSGQHFRRDGKVLERTNENIDEIAKLIQEFREQRLPRWNVWGLTTAARV
jgi:SAM-dependent methyltransferase